MSNVRLVINLPAALAEELEPILLASNLSVDEVVRLYLRSLVTSRRKGAPLGLDDEMPIGKFRGEVISVVIRADPSYVLWLLGKIETFRLKPECLALLEQMQAIESSEPIPQAEAA